MHALVAIGKRTADLVSYSSCNNNILREDLGLGNWELVSWDLGIGELGFGTWELVSWDLVPRPCAHTSMGAAFGRHL